MANNNSRLVIPETRINIIDNSAFNAIQEPSVVLPVYLCAFASDKGKEEMEVITGDFEKKYGSNISFVKYGQPLLQAAVASNNGAVVIAKRVVAEDSTLANTIVVAKVTSKEVQKKNAKGELLYIDKSTSDLTTVAEGNDPAMMNEVTTKFDCQTVTSCKTLNEVLTRIEDMLNTEGPEFAYPLFVLSDNGRGLSNKKFRVSPNYVDSKLKEYMQYNLYIIENNKIIETIPFTMDGTIIEAGMNRSIESVVKKYSNQIQAKFLDSNVEAYISKLAELTKYTPEYIRTIDFLYGKDRRGSDIQGLKTDFESEDAFNINDTFGIQLESGSNGAFGENPLDTEEYTQALVEFFDGTFTDDIFDVDKYKIDIILDANYPEEVKEKIAALVSFRKDCMYFRDCGLGKKTIEEIKACKTDETIHNYNILDNHLSYDIIDPYTKKHIPVTVNYSLAKLLIEHFKNGRHRPLAGEKYNFILTDAIDGTVNFVPKVTPSYNQKQELADINMNYASYFGDKLIMETFWTSQEQLTQMSFANNVLAVQELIKAIRTKCPSIRYTFIDGDDLEKYKEDVNEVIDKYANNFYKVRMTYQQDETAIANKVFYAVIEVIHRDFNVAESFDIYILNKEV